jgi:CBS domain-containing protein
MTREVVTATADETVASIATKMADNGISRVVVADGKRIKGIFTERDLVRGIARDGDDDGGATVGQRMSSPVETVAAQVPVLDAAEMMEAKGVKRLPVVAGDEMVGIVTQTDITRGLVLLSPLRSVCDIMSDDLATIIADQTVAEAARIMAAHDISCVVVLQDGFAAGMLTEKDLARRVIAAGRKPSETTAGDVMSFPLQSVPPKSSVLSANHKMSALRLHRLVVLDDAGVRGIVSQTDIMRAVRADFERVETDRAAALTAITEHVQHIRGEVAELGDYLKANLVSEDVRDPAGFVEDPVAGEIAPRIQHIMDELARL